MRAPYRVFTEKAMRGYFGLGVMLLVSPQGTLLQFRFGRALYRLGVMKR